MGDWGLLQALAALTWGSLSRSSLAADSTLDSHTGHSQASCAPSLCLPSWPGQTAHPASVQVTCHLFRACLWDFLSGKALSTPAVHPFHAWLCPRHMGTRAQARPQEVLCVGNCPRAHSVGKCVALSAPRGTSSPKHPSLGLCSPPPAPLLTWFCLFPVLDLLCDTVGTRRLGLSLQVPRLDPPTQTDSSPGLECPHYCGP